MLCYAALPCCAVLCHAVSHSTVRFPVDSYLARIEAMAEEIARLRLPAAGLFPGSGSGSGGVGADNAVAVLAVVERYLYEEKRMRPAAWGRSNLPARSVRRGTAQRSAAQQGPLYS